jgi:Flp pilus assembly protein TadB
MDADANKKWTPTKKLQKIAKKLKTIEKKLQKKLQKIAKKLQKIAKNSKKIVEKRRSGRATFRRGRHFVARRFVAFCRATFCRVTFCHATFSRGTEYLVFFVVIVLRFSGFGILYRGKSRNPELLKTFAELNPSTLPIAANRGETNVDII